MKWHSLIKTWKKKHHSCDLWVVSLIYFIFPNWVVLWKAKSGEDGSLYFHTLIQMFCGSGLCSLIEMIPLNGNQCKFFYLLVPNFMEEFNKFCIKISVKSSVIYICMSTCCCIYMYKLIISNSLPAVDQWQMIYQVQLALEVEL